jgi:hypothetical protein
VRALPGNGDLGTGEGINPTERALAIRLRDRRRGTRRSAVETANASIRSAGYGASTLSASSVGAWASIQGRSPCWVRMTGIRSWNDDTSSFGVVVTMAQVGSSPFSVKMPANANSSSHFNRMCIGCYAFWPGMTFHP